MQNRIGLAEVLPIGIPDSTPTMPEALAVMWVVYDIREALPILVHTNLFDDFAQIARSLSTEPEVQPTVAQVLTEIEKTRKLLGNSPLGAAFAEIAQALYRKDHKARKIKSVSPVIGDPKRNYTAEWMKENWVSSLKELRDYLESKFPVSKSTKVIEDHLQHFALKMVEQDKLRGHLVLGKKIKMSVLRVWCFQTACTEIRGWGTDASLRESRGALTTRNRESLNKGDFHVQEFAERGKEVFQDMEHSDTNRDFWNPNGRNLEDDAAFNETMELCHQAILDEIEDEGEGALYMTLFDKLAAGFNRTQLAKSEGIPPNKVAAMLDRLKDALRHTPFQS